jgi:large subunit ribosomal protein L25
MDKVKLAVKKRDLEKEKANSVRANGMIPGVIYGNKKENLLVTTKFNDFIKVYRDAGANTIVELEMEDGTRESVLIYAVDYEPITDDPQHIDFLRVNMAEKLTAKVPLEFIGVAKAVKDLAGIFNTNIDELEVNCLPGDLPKVIKVDISVLNTFDDGIYIKDVVLPKGVEIDREPEELVANVVPPRSEEELAELNQEVKEEVDTVEVEKKGKEEEEKEGETTDAKKEGDKK